MNHVVLVNFQGFEKLIDALGGVTIVNPTKIISNEFDGYRWRFGKGTLHLDGRHALAYSRVRENTLDPADNDLTRGQRQQRVLTALAVAPRLAQDAVPPADRRRRARRAAHDRPLGERSDGARLAPLPRVAHAALPARRHARDVLAASGSWSAARRTARRSRVPRHAARHRRPDPASEWSPGCTVLVDRRESQSDELDELDESRLAGLLSLLAGVLRATRCSPTWSPPPPSPLLLVPLSDFDSWPAPFGPALLRARSRSSRSPIP